MSFSLNGETWSPKSTSEHTAEIMQQLNYLLRENNITDENGNVIQLSASYANAFYLLALADGNRFADMDQRLNAAINSFNIELCDDQQIQNLLPIAAMTRNPGSYSTLNLVCKVEAGKSCTIPAGTRAPFNEVYFLTDTDVLIDNTAGTEPMQQTVPATCDTLGPIAVLAGEVTKFENTIANLESVTNTESSVPGVAPETINELRRRMNAGNTITFGLDGCKRALEELTGINYARVYFNYNTSETMDLPGGIEINPRHAYIVVDGNSPDLAKTYSEYMNAPTQNAAGAPENFQNYTTGSGQNIPIYFDHAEELTVHVKVWLKAEAETGTQVDNQIKRDLLTASSEWTIGQDVSCLTTGAIFRDCTYTQVAYTEVSNDGITWEEYISIPGNVIPRLTESSIEVEQME